VRELDGRELRRAFAVSVAALLDEAQQLDPDREQRLRETVWDLVHTLPEHDGRERLANGRRQAVCASTFTTVPPGSSTKKRRTPHGSSVSG
jgi:hypothetical protein